MKPLKWKRLKPKFRITSRILFYFLTLIMLSLLLVGYIGIRGVNEAGRIAIESNAYLSGYITSGSIGVLEDASQKSVIAKAQEVAKTVSSYLESYPVLNIDILSQNTILKNISVQSFGETGSTSLLLEQKIWNIDSAADIFEFDPKLNYITAEDLEEKRFNWTSMSWINHSLSGYYKWENPDGSTLLKFVSVATLDGSRYLDQISNRKYQLSDTSGRLLLIATMDMDELLTSARAIQNEVTGAINSTQDDIETQRQQLQPLYLGMMAGIVIISCGLVFFLTKTITKPILVLTDGARKLAKGNFGHRVKVQTGDELSELADQFNEMAIALNDSYRDLEDKVAERTKIEKRRSEQLRTINEVGRKISSILSINQLLPYVVNSLKESFHYYNVEIYTLNLDTGKIGRQATTNSPSETTAADPDLIDKNSLVFQTFQTRRVLVVPDFSQEKTCTQEIPEVRSAVAVPIIMGRVIWGVIVVQSVEANAFDDVDLFTIQALADQIATAVTNVHLYNETRDLAVVEERNRLAREIHDTLTQGFAGIVLQLEAAEQSLHDDIKQAQEHLDRARILARENLKEARHSVWSLHPHPVEKSTIINDLRILIAGFIQNTGLRVGFNISGDPCTLAPDTGKTLLRICKEALTNIEKHAKANRVDMNLAFNSNTIELNVVDNGVGFDTSFVKHDGFGLFSMKERSQILNGILDIQSEKGRGTSIRVTIPIERRS